TPPFPYTTLFKAQLREGRQELKHTIDGCRRRLFRQLELAEIICDGLSQRVALKRIEARMVGDQRRFRLERVRKVRRQGVEKLLARHVARVLSELLGAGAGETNTEGHIPTPHERRHPRLHDTAELSDLRSREQHGQYARRLAIDLHLFF